MYEEVKEGIYENSFYMQEEYLLEQANAGYIDAMYLLAKLYWDEEQKDKALPWFRKAAEQDQADALCYMAFFERDKEKALANYLKAIDLGSAKAMSELGQKYLQGQFPVEEDEAKAFELFEQAAKLGDSEGYYWLAMCYRYGTGVEEDLEKAFNYAIKAYNALY